MYWSLAIQQGRISIRARFRYALSSYIRLVSEAHIGGISILPPRRPGSSTYLLQAFLLMHSIDSGIFQLTPLARPRRRIDRRR